MITLMLALATSSTLTAAPLALTPLRPRSSPGKWFTVADYPLAARRFNIEGIVGFRLQIGRSGTVEGCEITQSSNFEVLDTHTCRLLKQRATFYPALDERGKPMKAFYTARFRWKIERSASPIAPTT